MAKKKHPENLDAIIAIANSVYPDFLIESYYQDPKGNHGDTLARFIAAELVETFEPDETWENQLARAYSVLQNAHLEFTEVLAALQRERDKK